MIQELKLRNFLSFRDEVTFSFEATKDTMGEVGQVVSIGLLGFFALPLYTGLMRRESLICCRLSNSWADFGSLGRIALTIRQV